MPGTRFTLGPAGGRTRVPGMTSSPDRGHARLPHEWKTCGRDRALDEPTAEHACLSFGRVVEHAGLPRRHAVLALEKIDLHPLRSPAQPSGLRWPRGAHLDEYLVPADA